jgi:hypothetical protein
MTDERFNEIVDKLEDELYFDVSVNITYYDKGRTNCSTDDAYPPEIDYTVDVNDTITIDLKSLDITEQEASKVLQENDNDFCVNINGEPYDTKLHTEFQNGSIVFTLDKDDVDDEVIDDLVLEELENRC